MNPDETNKELYLFAEMNIHTGADMLVEKTLWHVLPQLPRYKIMELMWLEELLNELVARIITIADKALLTFLEQPAEEVRDDEWEEIIDRLLDRTSGEIEQIKSIFHEPLLQRLANGYSKWVESKPLIR